MKITQSKTKKMVAKLTVEVNESDYLDKVSDILKKYRKISLVIVLILSAIITPPDIASQVIVSVPIIVLYEISIYISKAVIRKQQRVLKKQTKSK